MLGKLQAEGTRRRGGIADALRRIVEGSAREWGLGARGAILLLALPVFVVVLGAATALLGKPAFKALTGEDGIAETLQVVCYGMALVGSLVLARRLRHGGRGWLAGLYVLLAAGLGFLVGEEISWGQRLVGWGTPAALEAVNKQGETNLHNIEGVGAAFKWIQCLVGAYGLFLPFALYTRPLARLRSWLSYLVPPASLAPYFGGMFAWRLYRNLYEPPERFYFVVSEFNEVLELVLALGFAWFVLFQLRRTAGPRLARRREWLRRLAGPARVDG